jgi:hypothetical protein
MIPASSSAPTGGSSPGTAGILVHAVPAWIRDRVGAGNWKDVASRRLLWNEINRPCHVVYFDEKDPESLLNCLPAAATDLVLEYSWWPKLLHRLSVTRTLRVHVRTHNAEALQQWVRDNPGPWPTYRTMRSIYGSLRLLYRDTLCRQRSSTLLGISDWDDRAYWSRLPGRAKIVSFPYYSPWPLLRPAVRSAPYSARRAIVTSLPGANDRIGRSTIAGLEQLSKWLDWTTEGGRWECVVSSGILGSREHLADTISLETVRDPWDFLCQVRVVAVLTDLGYGLKTTIVDALAAGCHVLVTPQLSQKLPAIVREHCIVVSPSDRASVASAGRAVATPPQGAVVNELLRQQALAMARRLFEVAS